MLHWMKSRGIESVSPKYSYNNYNISTSFADLL